MSFLDDLELKYPIIQAPMAGGPQAAPPAMPLLLELWMAAVSSPRWRLVPPLGKWEQLFLPAPKVVPPKLFRKHWSR
jgi:hypothetical protein